MNKTETLNRTKTPLSTLNGMKYPIYKLTINPNDSETGVEFIALVDEPAIQRNWIAFNSQNQQFKIQSEEKRVVSGPLIVADLPIYRRDKTGFEYYAVFDAPTIWQVVQKYFREQRTAEVNLMHDKSINGVFIFESLVIDSNRGINTPEGFDALPNGSWFGSFKVDNDAVWDEIKAGTFNGFSIEGFFDMQPEITNEQKAMEEIISIIQQVEE